MEDDAVFLMHHMLMFTLDRVACDRDVSSESVYWRGCWGLLASSYLQDVRGYRFEGLRNDR